MPLSICGPLPLPPSNLKTLSNSLPALALFNTYIEAHGHGILEVQACKQINTENREGALVYIEMCVA